MAIARGQVKPRLHEVSLTGAEVERILAICGPNALLVGGQSLAFWAARFDVEPIAELSSMVTTDADFIGSATVAKALLAALGPTWKMRTATMDHATSQVAIVYTNLPGGGVKQIDFLAGIVGLDTSVIRARAVEVELSSGVRFHVLHPLDVLESRLRNLQVLPSKRNQIGAAQARLAIGVVRRYIDAMLDAGEAPREVMRAINRVIALARQSRLARVAFDHQLEVLEAVPASRIAVPSFHAQRWPRVIADVAELRRKHAARPARKANQPQRN
jgi:hypothetical protein